jgi:membrane glycosyltransferase
VLGTLLVQQSGGLPLPRSTALGLLAVTCVVLFGPRLLGLVSTLREAEARAQHGGGLRLVASVLAETAFAALLSPVLMLHHTRIVLDIVLGRTTSWGAQNRHGTGSFGIIARHERLTTLIGIATLAGLAYGAPALLPWLAPLWVSWLLAIPLVALASSEGFGILARRLGLLVTPPEVTPDPLLSRARELRALTAGDEVARFRDLVLDPVLLHAHLKRLALAPAAAAEGAVEAARLRALRVGPAALSSEERALLSACPDSMRQLHRDAWRSWPVETWQLGRDLAQLPPDS